MINILEIENNRVTQNFLFVDEKEAQEKYIELCESHIPNRVGPLTKPALHECFAFPNGAVILSRPEMPDLVEERFSTE